VTDLSVSPADPLSVRNRADLLRLAIDRQHRRSTRPVTDAPAGLYVYLWSRTVVDRMADADFMVVALWRLQRLAEWAASASWATRELRDEIRRFKRAVPHLREIRDTQEHFDKYGRGIGRRQRKGEPRTGWGYGHGPQGVIMTYGRFKLDTAAAHAAAQELHRAIRAAVDLLASQDVHGGPETVMVTKP
jgi:hypothetical protein